jgi:hypothetical protein
MSGAERVTPAARRAGEVWHDEEYAAVLEMAREGLSAERIAARVGRSVGAVRARLRILLGPDVAAAPGELERVLRQRLMADPDYDWRARVRAEVERAGRFYWSPERTAALRDGWARKLSMAELTRLTGAAELEVAGQLVACGLATSVAMVALQTRCDPESTLGLRARMALDRAASAVWVLVVDGLRHGDRAKAFDDETTGKAYRHVSIHGSRAEAERVRDELIAEHERRGGRAADVGWTLAERTVGERGAGVSRHGRGNAA